MELLLSRYIRIVWCAGFLAASVLSSFAQSTLIQLSSHRGMVFDHGGKYLYITTANQTVLRYSLATRQIDATYNIGADINQLDIAPNDSFLLIADDSEFDPPVSRVHKLDLLTGAVTHIDVANYGYGTTTIAIAGNNRAFVTTYLGRPIWQIDLTTNVVTERTDAPGAGSQLTNDHSSTPIYRSADGLRLLFLGKSYGHLTFTYDALTNTFSNSSNANQNDQYCVGAINRDGTLVGAAMSIFRGASHLSLDTAGALMPVREFRNIGGGVAFHPTRDIVFGIDNFTDEVVAYDTKTYAELFRSTSGDVFFQTPLFMSGDGRYLAWSTANGIRLFNLPASFVTPTPPPPSLTEVQSVVFDHSGKYLYAATTSGAVHKYDYGAQTIVQTYSLGGSLNSIDVSPDDSFLLVAQAYEGLIQGICHKIDIRAGQISDFHYPRTPVYEPEGVTGVAFASAKRAFFTAAGGPWQIDLLTNQITSRNQPAVNGSTVISHSGDYSRLFFALARLAGTNNPTEGSFETYETLTDSFSAPLILTNREFDNPAFSIDRTGNLLATKQGRSVSIDSAAGFKYVHTLTGIDGGITFDPTSDTFFGVDTDSDQIVAWDTKDFERKFKIDIGEDVAPIIGSFGSGNLVSSPDGHSLAVITPTTVRVLPVGINPTPVVPSTEFSKVARDLVFDHAGKYLYASTADGVVQRYNVATGAIDETYEVGGILNGIDIAADDSLLVIAEAVPGLTEGAYHIVDLTTKKTTNAVYTMPDYEFGAWDVTISAKGTALGTTDSWSRSLLREIDLHTRTTNVRTDATNPQNFGYIGGQAPLYRSADGSHVCLIGQSGGFVYNAVTDTFGSHVSWDTGPYQTAAVNRDGTLAAGRFQFDIMAFQLPTLSPTHDMTNFDSPPHGEKSAVSGVVFDPLKDILYAIKTSTDQIVAFDTQTWVEKFRFNIDEAIDPPLDWSTTIRFGVGRVAASSDSRFLALITPLTVRVYDLAAVNKILPAPPPPPVTPIVTISPASRNVSEGGPVEIIISATRYTNRPLTINYSISGTATFGVDYTVSDNLPQSGQIVIPPGHDTVDIWVNTIPDHVTEPTEKMTMTLQPGSGYKFPPVGKSKKKKKPPATALTILDAP